MIKRWTTVQAFKVCYKKFAAYSAVSLRRVLKITLNACISFIRKVIALKTLNIFQLKEISSDSKNPANIRPRTP